jgi:hypothetical protein
VHGLWGFSATDIWGAAENGRIIHKTATGWSASTLGAQDFYAIWGAAANDIWLVGELGGRRNAVCVPTIRRFAINARPRSIHIFVDEIGT